MQETHNNCLGTEISGTNVLRKDPYLEKNHPDFRTVIFGAKTFFTENRIFSIFAEKKKKWIKNSYFWKRRVSLKREKRAKFFDVKSMEMKRKLQPEKFV